MEQDRRGKARGLVEAWAVVWGEVWAWAAEVGVAAWAAPRLARVEIACVPSVG